jgi:MFS family permease
MTMPDPAGFQTSPPADSSIQTTPPPSTPELPPTIGPSARSAMFIVFIVVFIDLLGFGIVLPLLPIYGESYVDQLVPGGKSNRMGGAILGLLMASFSAMQFIFSPIWGRISDRIGRRPILLQGLLTSVVFYALFGYASDLPKESAALALTLLFVARLGQGIAGATIAAAQAVIADCTTPEKRKVGMALIGAAFGIGFTFGPLIGFMTLSFFQDEAGHITHPGAIGYVASGLSLIAFILGIVLLPETRQAHSAPAARKWFNWAGLRLALDTPGVPPVLLIFFLATLGFASFEVTLGLLNKNALELPENKNFLVFAYVGLVLLLTQGFIYRRLAPRLSEATFIALGIVFMGVGVCSLGGVSWAASEAALPFEGLLTWTLISLTVAVMGFAFLTPSAQALISRRSDPARQGEILGVNQSAAAMARILGPIFGLTLYQLDRSHLLPYAFGGLILLLMVPLLPRIRRGG